ncbi:IS3 family transposase [Microbispora sp. KK1-11]|uniref:IS3 family transposase n=1 Tax=Microbispora sp. KK1-11 TaxID=2053005 RepID=UPI001159ED3F|nr:IS3 family transposase [Microbispora sp. KK1-11]
MAGIDEVEIAVAEYIDWYNHRRLHGELGRDTLPFPPVEANVTGHAVAPAALELHRGNGAG